MKRVISWFTLLLAMAAWLPATRLHAHEGGHPRISAIEAEGSGRQILTLLIKKEKVGENWREASLERAEIEVVEGTEEWHLVFFNRREPDVNRPRVHVFLTGDGQFLGANFTGRAK